MPKLRSVDEVVTAIQSDLAKRKAELQRLYKAIANSTQDGELRETLMRVGVVAMYGHWEGFVKNAASWYIEYVVRKLNAGSVPFDRLTDHFRALFLYRRSISIEGTETEKVVAVFRSYFDGSGARELNFKFDLLVNTAANLNAKVFRTVVFVVDFHDPTMLSHAQVLNGTVVERRMPIAHGALDPIDWTEYNDYHEYTIKALDRFHDLVEDAVRSTLYLRPPTAA